jgi:hypothetical protein
LTGRCQMAIMSSMGIIERGGGRLKAQLSVGIRRHCVYDNRFEIDLIGPAPGRFCYVDVIIRKADGGFKIDTLSEKMHDQDLCHLFDNGMDARAWLDMLAERHPEYQEVADLYGQMMGGAK